MDVGVSSQILIERSPAEVSGYAANPDNAPAWYVNIRAVEWKMPPPIGVGSRIAFVAHFLGRRLAYTSHLKELLERETSLRTRTP